ncbi:MAG: formate/nitrite transporter family protein [Oscillospiraceae bacterium]|nr:formate/nitrite transporter family protein [Oscillospiraceae bacterium]
MAKKIISSLMCGMYISLGATAFLVIDNLVAGAIFFASGILLVSIFHNMLVTRIFALYAFKEYKVSDIITALLGNAVGCIIYAGMLSITRFTNDRNMKSLEEKVMFRLNDDYLSLFILAVICGFIVAAACLTVKFLSENRGAALALSVIFIAVFVICGFEHIVADIFFFTLYAYNFGFEPVMLPMLLVVAVGNLVGGIGTGYLAYYNRKKA